MGNRPCAASAAASVLAAALLVFAAAGCTPKRAGAGSSSAAPSSGSAGESAVSSGPSSEPEQPDGQTDEESAPPVSAASKAAPSKPQIKEVTVTFPEGFTISQIAARLEHNGVCKAQAFLDASNSFDCTGYPNASAIRYDKSKRCYKLEGYLYPDTYTFYQPTAPAGVVAKMLRNGEARIGSEYGYPGMTTDQIVTLASIIQREAARPDDMRKVSAVFHNRLRKGMPLQADSTVFYLTKGFIPDKLVDKYKKYYNTVRRCKGLPAGPICSPGAQALKAAADPADAGYLYFASDSAGNYYFAETYSEHLRNIAAGAQSPESNPAG